MTSAAHRTGKRKRKKLPWQVSAIIARLHADEVLCRYLHQKKGGEGTEERFFSNPAVARALRPTRAGPSHSGS